MLTNRVEINNLYRGPSIDASYQVSVHLAKWFQRRRLKCEKLTDARQQKTDDRRQVMATKWQTMIYKTLHIKQKIE